MVAIQPAHNFTFNGVTVNVYHADAGQGLPRHSHDVAHISFVTSGKTIVRKEGKALAMTKETQPVLLAAVEWHEIEAVEDGTVFVNII